MYQMSEDPVRYLVRVVFDRCESISSSDPNDVKLVPELVRRYLEKVSSDMATWKGIVQAHSAEMVSDLVRQIKDNVVARVDVSWEQSGEKIVWSKWGVSVLEDYKPPHFSSVPSDDYKRGMLVDGYTRIIYPQATFASKQEKWLADILEREESLRAWLRVPDGQLEIFYGLGDYNPDLIADDGKIIYLIEVKRADEVDDTVVQRKAAAALAWCQVATQVGLGDRQWVYRLVPHDCIDPTDSFAGVLSKASKVGNLADARDTDDVGDSGDTGDTGEISDESEAEEGS